MVMKKINNGKEERITPKIIHVMHSEISHDDKRFQELLKRHEIIDYIDYKGKPYPRAVLKGVKISNKQISIATSAIRAEETLTNLYKNLNAKERKLIDGRYNISRKYFEDALKCKSDKSRMVLFTLACEILYEVIARIIVRSIENTSNLHKGFQRNHAIKLRFGFDELKPTGKCLFGAKIKIKNAKFEIGKISSTEKDFFEKLKKKEEFDEGVFSDWIFKHGRYIVSTKIDDYLNQKHNVEFYASYIHLEVIFLRLRDGETAYFLGGLEEDLFIGIPCLFDKIKVSNKKIVSIKDFYKG